MKFICISSLAFHNKNEVIGLLNKGNYLRILELLSEYDMFLAEHNSKHSNKGRGYAFYMSSTISDEMIELTG